MKTRITAVLLLAGAAGAWSCARATPGGQDLPAGVAAWLQPVLVTIDTLRADRVGAYGNAAGLTPAIDRLAADGLRFDSARSHAPLTLPVPRVADDEPDSAASRRSG